MSRVRKPVPARPSNTPELLAAMARILVATGESPAALAKNFSAICQTLTARGSRTRSAGETIDLWHVHTHWHTDSDYLDARGKACALPLRGKHSVESLVRRVYPAESIDAALEALLKSNTLRERAGKYLPASRRAFLEGNDARQHALHVLRGLLSTVEHNINAASPQDRLFEASAENPRVPLRLVPLFEKQMLPRALTFLHHLDGDMKRRELTTRPGEPTARVGISVCFYSEPSEPAPARTKRARKARQ